MCNSSFNPWLCIFTQGLLLLYEVLPFIHVYLFVSQVQNAVEYLKMIGALDEKENLTVLGIYQF